MENHSQKFQRSLIDLDRQYKLCYGTLITQAQLKINHGADPPLLTGRDRRQIIKKVKKEPKISAVKYW